MWCCSSWVSGTSADGVHSGIYCLGVNSNPLNAGALSASSSSSIMLSPSAAAVTGNDDVSFPEGDFLPRPPDRDVGLRANGQTVLSEAIESPELPDGFFESNDDAFDTAEWRVVSGISVEEEVVIELSSGSQVTDFLCR